MQENYANDDYYTYNDNGDVTTQYKNDNSRPYVTYTYNDDGDLTQKVNTDAGLKYVYGTDSEVSVYRLSDNTLVQSYKEQSNEDEDVTTSSETHFGVANSYVTGEKNISYTHGDNTAKYSYDTNEDNENKTVSDSVEYNGNKALNAAYTYDKDGNVLTKKYSDILNFVNEYDSKDRITSTTYAGKTTNYTYDSNGQLVSANDDTYAYDSRGNITSKTESGATTAFTYSTDGWKDLLVKVNDDKLTYDTNGNVLTYGDKKFTWTYGRTLAGITDGENKYSYTYDENGIRTSKTVNGVTTYYNTDNGVILSQSDGDNTWYFQYDTNGSPLGFVLNGTQYFYITNQMGDILAITDTDGNVVGNYEYDAWGKVLTADTDIAKQNPLRYRGYYYDNETGYYYLQSRYYDSDICRFINADDYGYINKMAISGYDLFSYCSNDSINNFDIGGNTTEYTVAQLVKKFISDYLLKGKKVVSSSKVRVDRSGLYYVNVKFKKSKNNTNKLRVSFGKQYDWYSSIDISKSRSSKMINFYAEQISNSFSDCSAAAWKNCGRELGSAISSLGVVIGNLIYSGTKLSKIQTYYNKVWSSNGIDPRDRKQYVMFLVTKEKKYNGCYILRCNCEGYKKI